jgi:hypothetical protein
MFVLLCSSRASVSVPVFITFCCESFDFPPSSSHKAIFGFEKYSPRPLLYYLHVNGDSQYDGQVLPDGGYQCFRPNLMLKRFLAMLGAQCVYWAMCSFPMAQQLSILALYLPQIWTQDSLSVAISDLPQFGERRSELCLLFSASADENQDPLCRSDNIVCF